jgi:predicted porin
MKKHLIAAAVAGALAVPAMAQVTISGYIESGITSNERNSDEAGAAATAKVKRTQVGTDPFGTNNITFKGTEDLGGGLKAQFQLTQEFGGDSADSGNEANEVFEAAWVQLSGGFGSVRLGTFSDPAQEAGAVHRFFGDVGRNELRKGSNEDNSISYTSPKFSGFAVTLYTKQDGKSDANVDGAKVQSFLLRGDVGPVKLGVSHQKYNDNGADNNDDIRQYLSLRYNAGVAQVGLGYFTLKDDSSATDEKTKGTSLQVMVPFGAFKFGIGYNEYKDDAEKARSTHLMGTYALSKRTSVNFAYETAKTDAAKPNEGPGDTDGISTEFLPNATTKGMALSVSHKF